MSMIRSSRGRQLGIVPRLLIASLGAVIVAVVVVQLWTLHLVRAQQMVSAQHQLSSDMLLLRHVLGGPGSWRLDASGALLLNDRPPAAAEAVRTVHELSGADVTIFSEGKRIATTLAGPDGQSLVGTQLASGPIRSEVLEHGRTFNGPGMIAGVNYLTEYMPILDDQGHPIGILFAGIKMTEASAVIHEIVQESLLIGLLVICVVGAIRWMMLNASMRPLTALASSVRQIANGDLEIPTPCADRTDQLGAIGRAIETLRLDARVARDNDNRAAADRTARDRSQAAMDQLTRDFATTISGVLVKLGQSADEVRRSATDMTQVANRTRTDMFSASGEAEVSAQNLSSVAAATDELTANGNEINRQVDQVSAATRSVAVQAQTTVQTVEGLDETARQIGTVVELINQISGQTNLLALNATIEAARAGDAGKGFAVVASEVKQLAAQTHQATARISQQVGAIQVATAQAVSAVRDVSGAIQQAGQAAATIAASVGEQGAATREIARKVQTVSQTTATVTDAMRGASDLAGQSEERSRSVLATAGQVAEVTSTLRAEVDDFLAATATSWQNGDRRRYERISGEGFVATLSCTTHGSGRGDIADISLGGVAVQCDWPCDIGNLTLVGLPGSDHPVTARVVSSENHLLHVAFRQDQDSLAQIGKAITLIEARRAHPTSHAA
ncbi:MAG: methyl-accepting chemotaxis protein [Janthinobacterium lividum]